MVRVEGIEPPSKCCDVYLDLRLGCNAGTDTLTDGTNQVDKISVSFFMRNPLIKFITTSSTFFTTGIKHNSSVTFKDSKSREMSKKDNTLTSYL